MAQNDIILGIFKGKYTTRRLPITYYRGVSIGLMDQIEKGIGGDKTFDALLSSLNDNAQLFAGAKTYQLTAALQAEAAKYATFKDYEPAAQAIYNKFEVWGQAEDNTALQQTLQAKHWQTIEEDADLFPLLKYSTIGDACKICAPLDGLTAPVNSAIWRRIYPCNHYHCYCIVTQETRSSANPTPGAAAIAAESAKLMSPVFLSNAGITKEIFTNVHPYFEIPKGDRKFAKENFGLPIK